MLSALLPNWGGGGDWLVCPPPSTCMSKGRWSNESDSLLAGKELLLAPGKPLRAWLAAAHRKYLDLFHHQILKTNIPNNVFPIMLKSYFLPVSLSFSTFLSFSYWIPFLKLSRMLHFPYRCGLAPLEQAPKAGHCALLSSRQKPLNSRTKWELSCSLSARQLGKVCSAFCHRTR